jgi:hypothetical protein
LKSMMSETSNKGFDRPISLKQLAEELGHHPSSIRKMVVGRGFVPFRLREGKNKPLFLKLTDAESFKRQIESEHNNTIIPKKEVHDTKFSGVYFIEIPSYDGVIRVKIGWSDKLSDRFATYRTIIPDLRVKAIWPTSDAWCERAALKCAERLGLRVHQELFEFEDSNSALTELNELFLKLGIKNKNKKEV